MLAPILSHEIGLSQYPFVGMVKATLYCIMALLINRKGLKNAMVRRFWYIIGNDRIFLVVFWLLEKWFYSWISVMFFINSAIY